MRKPLRIAVITDIHYGPDRYSKKGDEALLLLKSFIRQVNSMEVDLVVDLGGGAVLDPTSRMLLRGSGVIVWLKCAIPVLWHRIQRDPRSSHTRPSLSTIDGLQELHLMLRDRTGIYSCCADYTIDTTALSPEDVAEAVVQWFRSDDNQDSADDEPAEDIDDG